MFIALDLTYFERLIGLTESFLPRKVISESPARVGQVSNESFSERNVNRLELRKDDQSAVDYSAQIERRESRPNNVYNLRTVR